MGTKYVPVDRNIWYMHCNEFRHLNSWIIFQNVGSDMKAEYWKINIAVLNNCTLTYTKEGRASQLNKKRCFSVIFTHFTYFSLVFWVHSIKT